MTMATPLNPVKEALKKIDAQLECPICFEPYTEPKLLPCFHVFCKHCLDPLVVQERDGPTLCCPNCRRSTTLPPNGVSGLQSDFHVDHLFEIRETLEKMKEPLKTQCEKCEQATATGFCRDCGQFICDKCTELHQLWKEFKGHQIVTIDDVQAQAASLIPPKKKVAYCPRHPENVLKIYCETDSELICTDCTVRLHKDHQYDLVTDTFPKHRDEILSHLQSVRQHLDTVNEALQALDTRTNDITDQRSAIEADIHKRVNQLLRALEQRRTELIGQLDQITQQKLKDLAAQRDQTELLQAQFSSCLEYVEGSLTTGTEEEILAMKTPVVKHIHGITADFNPDTLPPRQDADMLLIADNTASLTEACRKFADVTLPVDHAKCYATWGDLEAGGGPGIVTLHTVKGTGEKCAVPIRNIATHMVCCREGTTVKGEVVREPDGNYRMMYQSATRGQHKLHVRIDGKNIRDSPYSLVFLPTQQNLRKPIRTIENLKGPMYIATDSKGRMIVFEHARFCISVFSPEGQKIHSFGKHGTEPGQFMRSCIATDMGDNIIVVDMFNHRIQKFTQDGVYRTSVGTKGDSQLQFNNPVGIGFNKKNGKLYVCDQRNNRVQILESNLSYHSTFGTQGSGNGQFKHPTDVAFDGSGNVYIADWNNHRIQVFTPEGMFLRKFGELNCPMRITIDSCNRVYIAQWNVHDISIFTTEGQFLTSFGGQGCEAGKFQQPSKVIVDDKGFIVVTDEGNGRIQIF